MVAGAAAASERQVRYPAHGTATRLSEVRPRFARFGKLRVGRRGAGHSTSIRYLPRGTVMATSKPIYGSFLFSAQITGDRFEQLRLVYKFARCIVLANVPVKQIEDSPYSGERLLRLQDGHAIRLRGISLDDF